MIEKVKAVFTRPVRLWLYGIGVAVQGVLIIRGVVNVEEAGAWFGVLAAVLGFTESGMAALNAREPKLPLHYVDRGSGGWSRYQIEDLEETDG